MLHANAETCVLLLVSLTIHTPFRFKTNVIHSHFSEFVLNNKLTPTMTTIINSQHTHAILIAHLLIEISADRD